MVNHGLNIRPSHQAGMLIKPHSCRLFALTNRNKREKNGKCSYKWQSEEGIFNMGDNGCYLFCIDKPIKEMSNKDDSDPVHRCWRGGGTQILK
jgi:hypothetical protein